MPFDSKDPQQLAEFEAVADRFGSYEARVAARQANSALIEKTFYEQQGQTFVAPELDKTAIISPHAKLLPYIVEPNNGPREGFRPVYFFDLDTATSPYLKITVSGNTVLPEPGSFSYTASGIDPLLPMADFLSAVATGLGNQQDVYFGVEREGTCLSVVGQPGHTLDNVAVVVEQVSESASISE